MASKEGDTSIGKDSPSVAKTTNEDKLKYSVHESAVYRRIFKTIHTNAEKDPKKEKKKCTDVCCRTCVSSKCCEKCYVEAHNMSPALLRGRATGWVIHREIILPLMRDTTREILVSLEILTAITALGLSAASYVIGKKDVFNIVHLALTITATVLALVDGVFSLRGRVCRVYCCCQKEEEEEEKVQGKDTSYNLQSVTDAEAQKDVPGGCKNCLKTTKNNLVTKTSLDFARIILTEAILYPLLICDLFELITGEPYNWKDKLQECSFVRFVLTAVSMICYVYVMRLAILAKAMYYTQKMRKPKKAKDETPGFDYSISNWSFYFQGYFFYHVLTQMIAQILMIVIIAAKIRYDDLFQSSDTDHTNKDGVRIPYYLWYMLVGGFVFPVFGFLTFLIGTYYWVQEFSIGLCKDMLNLLQMPEMCKLMKFKESPEEYNAKIEKITEYAHYDQLEKYFDDQHQRRSCCKKCLFQCQNFWKKFMYPFLSPLLVIFCLFYTLLQLAFMIFAGFASEDHFGDIYSWKAGPWVWVYVASIVIGVVANMHAIIVVLFWAVVLAVILLIILVIMLIALCIFAIILAFVLLILIICLILMVFCDNGTKN